MGKNKLKYWLCCISDFISLQRKCRKIFFVVICCIFNHVLFGYYGHVGKEKDFLESLVFAVF